MTYRYNSILLTLALLFGCAQSGKERAATATDNEMPRLMLFCGAGIQLPVAELVEEFSRNNDCVIEADYAGSEFLLSRITLDKRGDLYMPGDRSYVDMAAEAGMIESSIDVCYFVPTILVQKGNPKKIDTLEDLTRKDVRLGLGNADACAIGRQSKKIFNRNNIRWEDVEENLAFQSHTVNELGIQIQAGSLDAVVVWDAVANQFLDYGELVEIPRGMNVISTVPVGILNFSEHKELAERFAEFAVSDQGKAIFLKHNYRVDLP